MPRLAYLFERFPAFGQTFCYREIAELKRQGWAMDIFSIRRPTAVANENWDPSIAESVEYLPDEQELLTRVQRANRARELPPAAAIAIEEWNRRPDFLRLQQAACVGLQLRQHGVGHVHVHFAGMAARTAYWIAKFFGITFTFTAHANDIFVPTNFEIGLEQLVSSAAAVVTVSDFGTSFLRDRFPQQAAKLHRIYNGLDPSRFAENAEISDVPCLLSIGRLIEKKGFRDLISACGLLRDSGRKFRCEIIGDGPLRAELQTQIDTANLSSVVSLSGPQSQAQISAALSTASVFVLPAIVDRDGGMDNLPTVIMEGMAAGLPVVATAIGGILEMVEENASGLLVPERDPAALASAIEQLLADPERARSMGARGQAIAAEKFSIEKNVRALGSILRQFTAG